MPFPMSPGAAPGRQGPRSPGTPADTADILKGRRYTVTVFKEHLAHDERSGGKVSSTPTPITFAIHSRDTQTHPETTHNEKHTWETRRKWKIDREWLRARTTQGTLRDTVTHFTVCAMSLNTLELSDLVDCSCKETFYPQHTAVVDRVGTFCKSHGDSLELRPQLPLKRKPPQTCTGV